MRTRVRTLCATALTLLGGCAPGGDAGPVQVLRLAHVLDTTHPVHQGMVHLVERLREVSDGELELKIYPGGQLGSEREALELLQIGSVAMTKVSSAVLENFDPRFKVFGLPYLFRDDTHRFAVLDGPIGQGLLEATARYRFRGICYFDAGSRSFYTTSRDHPIRSPTDLRNLKVRVMNSPMAILTIKALGAGPTPIAWGELYTALQQGVVDAAENNPPSFYTSGHYEVCPSYSLDEHTAIPDVLLISETVWQSLTDRQRAWLRDAAHDAVVYQRELWREFTEASLRKVEAAGVEVIRPDKAPFREQVRSLYNRLEVEDPGLSELARRIGEVR